MVIVQKLARSRRMLFVVLAAIGILLVFGAAVSTAEAAGIVDATWTRQFGGVATSTEVANALDTDGNIYIIGFTDGALPGEINLGTRDVFIRKYDDTGTLEWSDQFGTTEFEEVFDVAVGSSGVYVVGFTSGTLPGETNAGNFDGFIRKYNTSGVEQWTDQFGTSDAEEVFGVTTDDTSVYVVGNTEGTFSGETNFGGRDAFIRKYDTSGTVDWTEQFGTSALDDAFDVIIESGVAYVAGMTEGALSGETQLGGGDAFLVGYNSSGTNVLTEQFGTSSLDEGRELASHIGDLYVSGNTEGVFSGQTGSGGPIDAFVRKYDTSANETWTRQFGAAGSGATAEGFDVGAIGVFVSGGTEGSILPDQQNEGLQDAYVRRYDINGTEVWTTQFGTSDFDTAFDIGVDGTNVYVGGQTSGVFDGQTGSGASDAFLTKFVQDTDGDGIYDNVDLDPNTVSDDFGDGSSTGDIQNDGQQILSVIDAANGTEGIFGAADPTGGAASARLDSCNNAAHVFLDAGEAATLTCGSATVLAEHGVVTSVFLGDDGTNATSSLSAGSGLTFDPVDNSFEPHPENTEPVEVEVDGEIIIVPPPSDAITVKIVARVLDQSGPVECIDPSAHDLLAVVIASTPVFDAETVDPLTVTLNEALPVPNGNGVVSLMRDVNDDGLLDRAFRFWTDELVFEAGMEDIITLVGETVSDDDIIGMKQICVVEEEEEVQVEEEHFEEAVVEGEVIEE